MGAWLHGYARERRELGPGAGRGGGRVVAEGTPEQIASERASARVSPTAVVFDSGEASRSVDMDAF